MRLRVTHSRLRSLFPGLAALALLAGALAAPAAARLPGPGIEGDVSIGSHDAPVIIEEYFSPTCPACLRWHDEVLPQLKARYLNKSLARLVLKEAPSHNKVVDAAIFAIARCAGERSYLIVIDGAFAAHDRIERASRSAEGPREILDDLAALAGIEGPDVATCINSLETRRHLADVRAEAIARGVTGTPTLFVNGQRAPAEDASDVDRVLALVASALARSR